MNDMSVISPEQSMEMLRGFLQRRYKGIGTLSGEINCAKNNLWNISIWEFWLWRNPNELYRI